MRMMFSKRRSSESPTIPGSSSQSTHSSTSISKLLPKPSHKPKDAKKESVDNSKKAVKLPSPLVPQMNFC